MKIIDVRNTHEALGQGLMFLLEHGKRRNSRDGDVIVSPVPVTTVYQQPHERVVFHAERDYNIFFNLYESLWMLAGRRDVAPLKRYVKNFDRYSDDGATLHGAYGHRWRRQFGQDQLLTIADILKTNPDDRRCVLQMWDTNLDLGRNGVDVPCNDMATFQVGNDGRLNMVVFCRSNDIIWGAYFANAFHFSMLLDYMALKTGFPAGTYTQVSVNYHAYVRTLSPELVKAAALRSTHMYHTVPAARIEHADIDTEIAIVLSEADGGFKMPVHEMEGFLDDAAMRTAYHLLRAHHLFKEGYTGSSNWMQALTRVNALPPCDWTYSARQWLERHMDASQRGRKA